MATFLAGQLDDVIRIELGHNQTFACPAGKFCELYVTRSNGGRVDMTPSPENNPITDGFWRSGFVSTVVQPVKQFLTTGQSLRFVNAGDTNASCTVVIFIYNLP